jgi:hypothetical protein
MNRLSQDDAERAGNCRPEIDLPGRGFILRARFQGKSPGNAESALIRHGDYFNPSFFARRETSSCDKVGPFPSLRI